MRIALLNLPYDNNYGGNLQRYALMKVLQNMGHKPVLLDITFPSFVSTSQKMKSWLKQNIKYILVKFGLIQNYGADYFFHKYIRKTNRIYNTDELNKYNFFDAYIAGSDQIWRKKIAQELLPFYYFDFIQDKSAKKIVAAASFGTDENELDDNEIQTLGKLYSKVDAVSVREKSGIKLLSEYGWNNPAPVQLIDPTFLLEKQDYLNLIDNCRTEVIKGELFCYILDDNEDKRNKAQELSNKHNLTPFTISIHGKRTPSVEQWLRSFRDAKMIFTDSFHGMVFSIIFNKPFVLIKNQFRGVSRFDTILEIFDLPETSTTVDWEQVNATIEKERNRFLNFLNNSLK